MDHGWIQSYLRQIYCIMLLSIPCVWISSYLLILCPLSPPSLSPSSFMIYVQRLLLFLLFLFLILLLFPLLCTPPGWRHTLVWRVAKKAGLLAPTDPSLRLHHLQEENSARLEAALSYLSSLAALPTPSSPWLTIAVVTRDRQSPQGWRPAYLPQSLAAYLREAGQAAGEVGVVVCDVQVEGTQPEMELVSGLVPVVARRQEAPGPPGLHRLEREKQDYVFCLREAARWHNSSQAVLVVEDDSLPLPGLVHHLRDLLARRSRSTTAFIKLFHPVELQGYLQPEPHRWVEWVALALLLLLLQHALLRTDLPLTSSFSLPRLLLTMILLEVVGRQTLLPLRPTYSLVPAPSCCTPANLYPAPSLPALLAALETTTCGPGLAKDFALVEVVSSLGRQAWAVQPNLVRHVGVVSSLHAGVNLAVQD